MDRAAVTAAGTLATIVKVTQNALIGGVAVALTAYLAFKVEKTPGAERPGLIELWRRFPKFVLGFVAASVLGTIYASSVAAADNTATQAVATNLRTWFLILAFVSIGLEFRVTALREAGWRPIAVFASATVVNIGLALGLAALLFAGFTESTTPPGWVVVMVLTVHSVNAMIPAPGETGGDWWEATGQAAARRANEEPAGRDPDAAFDPAVVFFHDVAPEVTAEGLAGTGRPAVRRAVATAGLARPADPGDQRPG